MIWTIQSGFFVIYLLLMMNISTMKTIYAANGYIAERRCGISWTEKKLANHTERHWDFS
jgi:hypothetical protein